MAKRSSKGRRIISPVLLSWNMHEKCGKKESRPSEAKGRPLGTRFSFGQGPFLRTAPKDHQPPPTASCQPPAATNRQPAPTANRHQPPITNHQPPPTTTNRHQPPVANRQSPPPMVEHMSYTRSFYKTAVQEHFFFSPKDPPAEAPFRGLGVGKGAPKPPPPPPK